VTHALHEIPDVFKVDQGLELKVQGAEGGDDVFRIIFQNKGGAEEQGTYLFALGVPGLDHRVHALLDRTVFRVAPRKLLDQHSVPGKKYHVLVLVPALDKVVQKGLGAGHVETVRWIVEQPCNVFGNGIWMSDAQDHYRCVRIIVFVLSAYKDDVLITLIRNGKRSSNPTRRQNCRR